MKTETRQTADSGFTLVEVLVTVLILGLLAAVVFPVVIQQIDKADPVRAANDLANIRTGLETFRVDFRPDNAGDLEDLVNEPGGGDATVTGSSFGSPASDFDGPYIDQPLASTTTANADGPTTGFDAVIEQDLVLVDKEEDITTTSGSETLGGNEIGSSATHVAVVVDGLTSSEFSDIDAEIDGESSTTTTGKFRYDGSLAYFLAIPFRN